MVSQAEKGRVFRALHGGADAFVIPNPWDVGSARLLAHLGFKALATTSAGYAFSIGKRDNAVGREAMIRHVGEISAATDLPVSADLENGFGDAPEEVAETFWCGAEAGLVAASVEDSTGRDDQPIYDIELAADRVRAAVSIARALPYTFTVTARCENFLVGRPDLGDTIARLQAYQVAGADVLYAPGLVTREDIAAVVRAVDRPVNVLMGQLTNPLTVADMSALGVKRVSVGGALCRAAYGEMLRAAKEMQALGTFSFADTAISHRDVSAMFDS